MNGTHPFPRRRRHPCHRGIEAIEVPMLVAEIARDDPPVNVRVRCLTTVVADDRSTILVLQSVTVSIFLSDSTTSASGSRVSSCGLFEEGNAGTHVILEGGRCSFESINSPFSPTATVTSREKRLISSQVAGKEHREKPQTTHHSCRTASNLYSVGTLSDSPSRR